MLEVGCYKRIIYPDPKDAGPVRKIIIFEIIRNRCIAQRFYNIHIGLIYGAGDAENYERHCFHTVAYDEFSIFV